MKGKITAGFMVYLVLSIMIIFPVLSSGFIATISGDSGVKNIRKEVDITNIQVQADNLVNIKANDGNLYPMNCSANYCSYTFPENTLSPGSHQIIFTQSSSSSEIIKEFFVDNESPKLVSSSIKIIKSNNSAIKKNKLNITLHVIDPKTNSDDNSCAGLKTISLSTETKFLLDKEINGTCDFLGTIQTEMDDVEGNISIFATLTDRVGNSNFQKLNSLSVDFKAPSIENDFDLLRNGEPLENIAKVPKIIPFVDLRFTITEADLANVTVNASSLTMNPNVFPTYTNLNANCKLKGSKNVCLIKNLELRPANGTIKILVTASDKANNYITKTLTKTFEMIDYRGEINYFNPPIKNCFNDTCYIKKGLNDFEVDIIHNKDIEPSLIKLVTGDLTFSNVVPLRECNKTSENLFVCFASIPVMVTQSGITSKILLFDKSTDAIGNSFKGLSETKVELDADNPELLSLPELSSECPTAGMDATLNISVKDITSPELNIKVITNKTTTQGIFNQKCKKVSDKNFSCEVVLNSFVNYPEKENMSILISDLAGNKKIISMPLEVCQAESSVPPETINNIFTSTTKKINKRLTSITATKTFLPLTFNIQSNIAKKTKILGVKANCMNTRYLAGEPYLLNEKSFVKEQDNTANRGELILVVPVGNQQILENSIDINCSLDIYEQIGETYYTLPEKQNFSVSLDVFNNPLGSVDKVANSQLVELKKEIDDIGKDIDNHMKVRKTLKMLCDISSLLGKVFQAISIIESAVYVVSLVLYAFTYTQELGETLWGAVCKFTTKIKGKLKSLWPQQGGVTGILTKFMKFGCTIYKCGLCTVDGLMATANFALTAKDIVINQDDIKSQKDLTKKQDEVTSKTDKLKSILQTNKDDAVKNLANSKEAKNYETKKADLNAPVVDAQEKLNNYVENNANILSATTYDEYKQGYTAKQLDEFSKRTKQTKSESSQWILDPFKSEKYAKICFCNAGKIYALNKDQQLKCREYTCIKESSEKGLPITDCLNNYKVANCLYVQGAMTKRSLAGQVLNGIKEALFSDPIKTARMAVCIEDYLPISWGGGNTQKNSCKILTGWRNVFCGVSGAYLQLREIESLFSNPFKDQPIKPDGEDYCQGIVGEVS